MPISDLTDEEKRLLKGSYRRAFRQSWRMKTVLANARVELPPALKKDGKPGARNQVRYNCAVCFSLFPSKYIAVVHIYPVVPVDMKESDMSPNDLVDRIFCDIGGLQVICSTPLKALPKGHKSCHYLKSQKENFIRRGIKENGGTPEYWSNKYLAYLIFKELQSEQKEKKRQLKIAKKEAKKKGKE